MEWLVVCLYTVYGPYCDMPPPFMVDPPYAIVGTYGGYYAPRFESAGPLGILEARPKPAQSSRQSRSRVHISGPPWQRRL